MTSTTTTPPHASSLLAWLRENGAVAFSDIVLFEIWRDTDLTDIEIISALDWLTITNQITRSNDTLRCEVKVKS